ncbi:ABC-type dipeptide/oligopeptide/nickel transport systems, permease component [Archaeoglobus sulfaticallidus PM70-1]|uniref:ABC-type dipeptide/oligopeptide/nickel transport systems, permease component n=1 Tax=Archaeoglobus sulfaticallidus PM70-1 TaxID=387631 RepID=N0BD46_9EURY|nr:nickel ABC transporter permease [Archaeoglobus sulfaticallidus]AGK60933.1 ABC-type dipeptide/oligopeptide/nickel transport systems, permease component [Archaeoglobus sulfaticallidus PM70-1]
MRFIVKRLTLMPLVMIVASLLSFLIIYLAPGDPAEMILERQLQGEPTKEQIEAFKKEHDLDKPLYIQYFIWLSKILHGDLGVSLRTGEPVLKGYLTRFPASLQLIAASILIAVAVSIPLGILSALKHNTAIDHICRILSLFGISMPNFWLGLLLILIFSVKLRILPAFGYGAKNIVLPALTLGMSFAGTLTRLMRVSLLEVLHQQYIIVAKAKGLPEKLIITRHALKNAFIPVITAIGIYSGHAATGAVIVETIFAWPGVGSYFVSSIYARDYPVIQGFVLLVALFFILTNLTVDVIYLFLDPRIRYETHEA